jgi:hypothetical protein
VWNADSDTNRHCDGDGKPDTNGDGDGKPDANGDRDGDALRQHRRDC